MPDHDAEAAVQKALTGCDRTDCTSHRQMLEERLAALSAAGYAVVKASELERLRAELDEAQLRSIEARNPGIDMDEVQEQRRLSSRRQGLEGETHA